ncbi:alpha/beta hydrolase [Microbacterium sp. BH-3-3-3]|uniref:alpha/beta hydrolase n=1 Tax=Microbacterium sp. BH-3-3-3 TaxID=1906742 RepID=UPI0011A6AF4C|nr:alpha/beta hydrolase [Microbacterium sp. BH-3-3-3]
MTCDSARIDREVVYASVPGFRPLVLDLHRPAETGPSPVVLFLHGGGWMVGSRRAFCFFPPDETFGRLVNEGWAVASVDYRLSSEAPFPAPLEDARAARRWLDDHAAEYDLDPHAVAVWGESAGGHLAALLALEPDAGIRAAVDWYGPSDLADVPPAPTPAGPPSREARLLGVDPSEEPDAARAASPLHHVHAGAPPFLLAHGLDDRAIPHHHSERFAAALREAGVDVELQLVPGVGHIWSGLDDSAIVMDPAVAFLRRAFGNAV